MHEPEHADQTASAAHGALGHLHNSPPQVTVTHHRVTASVTAPAMLFVLEVRYMFSPKEPWAQVQFAAYAAVCAAREMFQISGGAWCVALRLLCSSRPA